MKIGHTIYEVPVGDLKEYHANPRVGVVEAIAESLRVNSQYRPIIVWREKSEVLAGNHTWKAAKSLGWETIDVVYVEGLTAEDAVRLMLADNRSADLGTYRQEALWTLLDELTPTGSDYFDQIIKETAPQDEHDTDTNIQNAPSIQDTMEDYANGDSAQTVLPLPLTVYNWVQECVKQMNAEMGVAFTAKEAIIFLVEEASGSVMPTAAGV